MLVSTPASCINIYVDNKNNYCIFYCLCINKKKKKVAWKMQLRTLHLSSLKIRHLFLLLKWKLRTFINHRNITFFYKNINVNFLEICSFIG